MSCEHDCDRPQRFPAVIDNRPGLSRFQYRIGDYTTMRAHMLDQLVKAPALSGWTYLGQDEPGIALLEGTALMGHILSFYQELYGNETKLPTASWQQSVFDLVRLTGYRPAPGLGGSTVFALEVDTKTIVPAGFAFQAQLEGFEQPSIFESQAAMEAFPAFSAFHLYRRRLGLQAVKGKTSLDIARMGGSTALADREEHGIEAGDRILILSGPLDPYEILVVAETEVHLDRVTLHLEGSVRENHPGEVTAFKIGRSFRHFGADAPKSFSTFRENPPKTIIHETDFNRKTGSKSPDRTNYSPLGRRQMPLDSEVDDLSAGSRVICVGRIVEPDARNFVFVRRIEKIIPRDVLWAGVSSPVSMLQLNKTLRTDKLGSGQFSSLGASGFINQGVIDAEAVEFSLAQKATQGFEIAADFGFVNVGVAEPEQQDIRRLRIYEVLSEKMILRAPPKQTAGKISDGKVNYFGTREEALALGGRRLLLAGMTEVPQDIVVTEDQPELEAAPKGPQDDLRMWPIQLGLVPQAGGAGFSETNPRVTVYGNLVDATEGESQGEVALGSGDSRRVFQTFPIPKSPLTYLSDPVRSPPYSAELEIRVDGRLWTPVESLFDAAPDAEIYVIRQGEDGSYVQFGDGINGGKLPSGRNNVTAAYRTGHGSWGELAVDQEPKAKTKLKPLTGVVMPGPAVGGAPPEEMATAQEAAPGRMQSLGRLVGLTDYEAEALAVPGVLKAQAVFGAEMERPSIVLTVLTEDESPEAVSAVEAALRHADRCRGPGRHPLEVIAGRLRYLHLSLLLGYDPVYRSGDLDAAVIAALGALPKIDVAAPESGLFALDQRRFGQDVHISQAIAAAQAVEGVLWVKPAGFAKLSATSDDPAELKVPAKPGLAARIGCAPSEILALSAHHVTLSATTVTSDEECPE